MIDIDKDEIIQLENGNFSNVEFETWYLLYYFDYIYAMIKGCEKNLDFSTLDLIKIYSQRLINNPHDIQFFMNKTELKELIHKLNNKAFDYEFDILTDKELMKLYNEEIIIACKNIVNKVEEIKRKYNKEYTDFRNTNIEKQRIDFIKKALKLHAIECWNHTTQITQKGKVCINIISKLFPCEIWITNIDEKILLKDKEIIAKEINKMIENDSLVFNNDMTPECYEEDNLKRNLK